MSAAERLQRILYILAVSSRPGGARLEHLARDLGIDIATIVNDIQEVTAREFYHPAGSTDAFTILLGKGTIEVVANQDFRRPTSLTALEALALGLGLRIHAADHGETRRAAILELAERLEAKLRVPEHAMRPRSTRARDAQPHEPANVKSRVSNTALEFGVDDARALLSDAARESRVCSLAYVRPGERDLTSRRVVPRRLIYASGRWYIATWDLDRNEPRAFRLDRIIGVDVRDEQFAPPGGDDMLAHIQRQGMVFVPDEATAEQVRVRYSPRVARWVAEHANADLDPDGSLTLTHEVSDPQWLIRHILQYAGDAVVETGPLREMIASAVARLCA